MNSTTRSTQRECPRTPRAPGRRRACRPWAVAALAVLASGCGDDGLGRPYPVTGRVTYRGLPVRSGTVTLHPSVASGRVAAGTIAEGWYTLTTLSPGDGALPGVYIVTVTSKEVGRPPGDLLVGGQVSQERVAAATGAAKDRVPARYQWPGDSGLSCTVVAKSNRLDFQLFEEADH